MKISDTRKFFDFISTHAAELNHVNVATSFRKLLQVSHLGVQDQSVQHALHTLKECVLRNMKDFGPQRIANTLHIMAKKRHKTYIL